MTTAMRLVCDDYSYDGQPSNSDEIIQHERFTVSHVLRSISDVESRGLRSSPDGRSEWILVGCKGNVRFPGNLFGRSMSLLTWCYR